MKPQEAGAIMAVLNAAFVNVSLEPESGDIYTSEIALLGDGPLGMETARDIVRTFDKFPTIHEFRAAYRSLLERRRSEQKAMEPRSEEPRQEIPEWVHVWWWVFQTSNDRRAFPQEPEDERTRLSYDEFKDTKARWQAAGAPKIRTVNELLGLRR